MLSREAKADAEGGAHRAPPFVVGAHGVRAALGKRASTGRAVAPRPPHWENGHLARFGGAGIVSVGALEPLSLATQITPMSMSFAPCRERQPSV